MAEEGAALEAARAAETEAILGAHPDQHTRPRRARTVWVSADGTMVHDQSTGTELEVKIGLVFDGAHRVGRTRRALTGRTLDAGTESRTKKTPFSRPLISDRPVVTPFLLISHSVRVIVVARA